MPLLVLLLLIILIATFGFWDTLQAVIGGVAILVLLCILVVALVGTGLWWALKGRR